jgi:glycosyltransferase involved in cell wall biosynthesis
MKRVLASAYDVNPFKGSESGTGWNFAVQLARYNHVTLVTRKNNKGEVERYIHQNGPFDNLKVEYFDYSNSVLYLKKMLRANFIYFNFWQLGVALSFYKRRKEFDICHGINFHADHVPQFLWVLGLPVIWGPLNHNELTPRIAFGKSAEFLIKSYLNFTLKYLRWNMDPFVRLAVARSTFIIGSTKSVQRRLKIPGSQFYLLSTIGCEDNIDQTRLMKPKKTKFLIVGRLVPIKGVSLAISAFYEARKKLRADASLVIIGDGPLRTELEQEVSNLRLERFVKFKGSLSRNDVMKEFVDTTALLFTSFEGGGAVVGESLSRSIPVILNKSAGASSVFDESYPLFIEGGNSKKDYIKTCSKVLLKCANLTPQDYLELSEEIKNTFQTKISWNSKGEELHYIYKQL